MLMWYAYEGVAIDVYGPGVTLETWEVNMLRKWGKWIP